MKIWNQERSSCLCRELIVHAHSVEFGYGEWGKWEGQRPVTYEEPLKGESLLLSWNRGLPEQLQKHWLRNKEGQGWQVIGRLRHRGSRTHRITRGIFFFFFFYVTERNCWSKERQSGFISHFPVIAACALKQQNPKALSLLPYVPAPPAAWRCLLCWGSHY